MSILHMFLTFLRMLDPSATLTVSKTIAWLEDTLKLNSDTSDSFLEVWIARLVGDSANGKIQCIKVVREKTGLGLKESKELVEKVGALIGRDWQSSRITHNQYNVSPGFYLNEWAQSYYEDFREIPTKYAIEQWVKDHYRGWGPTDKRYLVVDDVASFVAAALESACDFFFERGKEAGLALPRVTPVNETQEQDDWDDDDEDDDVCGCVVCHYDSMMLEIFSTVSRLMTTTLSPEEYQRVLTNPKATKSELMTVLRYDEDQINSGEVFYHAMFEMWGFISKPTGLFMPGRFVYTWRYYQHEEIEFSTPCYCPRCFFYEKTYGSAGYGDLYREWSDDEDYRNVYKED